MDHDRKCFFYFVENVDSVAALCGSSQTENAFVRRNHISNVLFYTYSSSCIFAFVHAKSYPVCRLVEGQRDFSARGIRLEIMKNSKRKTDKPMTFVCIPNFNIFFFHLRGQPNSGHALRLPNGLEEPSTLSLKF